MCSYQQPHTAPGSLKQQKWALQQDKQQVQVPRLQHDRAARLLFNHHLHQHSSL
jgi:hypothetical protein